MTNKMIDRGLDEAIRIFNTNYKYISPTMLIRVLEVMKEPTTRTAGVEGQESLIQEEEIMGEE